MVLLCLFHNYVGFIYERNKGNGSRGRVEEEEVAEEVVVEREKEEENKEKEEEQ